MTTRDTPWAPGTPCWGDLTTPDLDTAIPFYAGLFGWEFEDTGAEFGSYHLCRKDGRRVGGMAPPAPGDTSPTAWSTYLASADLDVTAAAVTAAGGTVIFPALAIGDEGRMCVAMDPTGATFGIWQSGHNTGMELANETGSVAWNECMTRDFATAKAFYGTVFGYDWFDMSGDGFTYAAFMIDGRSVGGLGTLGDDMPAELAPHWVTYFKVADAVASAARVVELGGSVQRPPWDTPFGTMCVVSDHAGARFCLMADNDQSTAPAAD
jgi:predicted enzyme related to lactoylglutathione lyase